MNRTIDNLVKHAKWTGRKVAQQLRLSETEARKKVDGKRNIAKESHSLRLLGPYQESPTKFRLKIAEGEVERSLTYRSLEQATEVKRALIRKHARIQQITVGEALDEWLRSLSTVRGLRPSTIDWLIHACRYWLPHAKLLSQISEAKAKQIYAEHVIRPCPRTKRPPAVATHHEQLLTARRLWDWAIDQGYCRTNPWKSVRKVGKRNKGKPQLRIDEARRLVAYALAQAKDGDATALGVLLMIFLGLRQGEVAVRVARDVDDEGRVLWIPAGKTENARRRLKVPELLQPLLSQLAHSKHPEKRIFYPEGMVLRTQYYWSRVKRLCLEAGVPVVLPHSLRGLHATLALDGGATADAVARALGHGSFTVTKQHYASASSIDNARSGRVEEALTVTSPPKTYSKSLSISAIEQLSDLLAQLRSQHQQAAVFEENQRE